MCAKGHWEERWREANRAEEKESREKEEEEEEGQTMNRRGGCMMYFIANRCKINQRYFCPVVPASFSSFLHLPGNRRVLSLPLFSSLSLTLSRFPAAFRALLLLPSCAFVSLRGGAVFVVHWPRSRFQNYIVQCSTPAPIFPLCRPLYSFTSFYARV